MGFREICHVLGKYFLYFSLTLLPPLGLALYYQFYALSSSHLQSHSGAAFAMTLLICLLLSFLLSFLGRAAKRELYRREGILVVVSIWIFTSIIAALPFYLSRTLTNPIDAYFEAMSGLTTTGASVICPKSYDLSTGKEVPIYLTNPHVPDTTYVYYGTVPPIRDPQTGLVLYTGIEAVGKALLFWRSFLQWIGGMGIVVIFLSVLPVLGVGGKFLYQMEITGPIKESLTPRIKDTASHLWKLYLFLTLLEIGLLFWTNQNMPFLDAICLSFSNISTGGFSIRNDNVASYQSAVTEWIVLLFMILGSINFALYFQILKMRFLQAYAPDFFLFLGTAIAGSLLLSFFLVGQPISAGIEKSGVYSIGEALREGSFQAVSAQTSSGFFTADYDRWPFPAQMFMLVLMFVGGMAGSTAGGIKTSRFYVLYKIVLHRLESIYRPDSVRKLRIGTMDVEDKTAMTVLAFFCIAAFFTVLGTVALILDGVDPETSLGLIGCFLNNVGIAFRAAGPMDSFAFLSNSSKLLATFWMLLGRLEFYIVLLLLLPTYWKNS